MFSSDLPTFDPIDYGIRLIEEERRRIARDLHDGPAQDLTNISMRLDVVQRLLQTDTEMAMNELSRTNSRIVAAINDIRRLIYDLRPVAIDEIGLVSATVELCRRCERDWQIQFEVTADPGAAKGLLPARQIALYRLIQEVLQNVKKHAQAQLVTVTISRVSSRLEIEIKDNGKGFNPSEVPDGHFGIVGMRERAAYLGGVLEIESTPGQGSTIRILVPIEQETETL
ncbi:sensor histidine kinase [Alicyclobacillus cycloheptanicus]|uniref:histidine kinase n=1 Tax=Alicyclobacillus cycloheptanicus TaxID=1457 RepID=A0ABT9XD70_9BACL|nr:sensor histidine kinase [Alicyclobacillus cycloheptanicus]MDQ0188243.1 two-component system sensor histidine kinase DegS [Alicyclobacillus cycloheptanicus]WDM00970.1 sensor histidine kinase [Alicyclobacillus cycloheptanicus]